MALRFSEFISKLYLEGRGEVLVVTEYNIADCLRLCDDRYVLPSYMRDYVILILIFWMAQHITAVRKHSTSVKRLSKNQAQIVNTNPRGTRNISEGVYGGHRLLNESSIDR